MAAKVLLAGGGFGGLYAARELERRTDPDEARIMLLNDSNFLLYTPLLPGVGGGTLDPRHVVVPLSASRSLAGRSAATFDAVCFAIREELVKHGGKAPRRTTFPAGAAPATTGAPAPGR